MQVKVKRRADDRKFLARVLAIGTECDIALLTGWLAWPGCSPAWGVWGARCFAGLPEGPELEAGRAPS